MKKPEVILVFRKPLPSTYSIEYLFHAIGDDVQKDWPLQKVELPYYSQGIFGRLANLFSLARYRGRVVHISGDCYYAILGAVGSKRIITIHDLTFLDRTRGLKRTILKWLWVRLPVHFSHQVTVVSQTTRQVLERELPASRSKTKVITNFIDPIYQPVERSFHAAKPRILQVGTAFNKNIPALVKALDGIPCTLVIIGRIGDSLREVLEGAGIGFENHFGLSIEALYEEYKKADFLAFVSTVEGFGMPILEAQASGLPVLTSQCSSMPEVAGEGAIFANPLDTASIRAGILVMINDDRKREQIIEKGYQNVKRFSREKIAREYLDLYHEISKN